MEERSRYNIRQAQLRKTATPPTLPASEPAQISASQSLPELPPATNTDIVEIQTVPASVPLTSPSPNKLIKKEPSTPIKPSLNPPLRQSTRTTKGSRQSVKFEDEDFFWSAMIN